VTMSCQYGESCEGLLFRILGTGKGNSVSHQPLEASYGFSSLSAETRASSTAVARPGTPGRAPVVGVAKNERWSRGWEIERKKENNALLGTGQRMSGHQIQRSISTNDRR
jgi:hypothetical protein